MIDSQAYNDWLRGRAEAAAVLAQRKTAAAEEYRQAVQVVDAAYQQVKQASSRPTGRPSRGIVKAAMRARQQKALVKLEAKLKEKQCLLFDLEGLLRVAESRERGDDVPEDQKEAYQIWRTTNPKHDPEATARLREGVARARRDFQLAEAPYKTLKQLLEAEEQAEQNERAG